MKNNNKKSAPDQFFSTFFKVFKATFAYGMALSMVGVIVLIICIALH